MGVLCGGILIFNGGLVGQAGISNSNEHLEVTDGGGRCAQSYLKSE